MQTSDKATALWSNFFKLGMPQIRAFHMTWFAFFLCFFAWFGIAPLMAVVRHELQLTKEQVAWSMIASVAVTIFARLLIGWLCDRIGPRRAYTWLLVLGSLPVMGIGLAHNFETFLLFRLLIGAIGASFVITQYHTSVMFAPNIVGTANATSAGWGNLGGGVTQLAMPLLFALFVSGMGFSSQIGWRLSMFVAGAVCLVTGVAYYFLTQDSPEGNFSSRPAEPATSATRTDRLRDYLRICRDYRVWSLFVIYGACFGIELTINNVAALYFTDYFGLSLAAAGTTAAAFGLMNLFARTLGGVMGDAFGARWGLKGRTLWLFMALFCEGIALMLFSQMTALILAVPALIFFSLFVQMSEGATYSVVPFINRKALGMVAGIVGAGGNAGAVAAGLLFKGNIQWSTALLVLGVLVTICSFVAFTVRFSPQSEAEAARELHAALQGREQAEGVALQPA